MIEQNNYMYNSIFSIFLGIFIMLFINSLFNNPIIIYKKIQ